MLCSRSASLTSSTRTSSAIASSSLRRFSACLASLVTRSSFLSLVRPSTSAPMSVPNIWSISARVAGGILDGVVQQRRRDGGVVELEVGQDRRDFERMGEIGVAGGALLLAMRLHGVDIGAVEQGLVGVRDCSAGPARPARTAASSAACRRLGFSVRSMACERRSSRSSSGARVRAWFCIRGRSVVERAMNPRRPADQRSRTLTLQDITAIRYRRKVAQHDMRLHETANGPDRAGPFRDACRSWQTLYSSSSRLLLRRREAFEALEQFFLGHAVDARPRCRRHRPYRRRRRSAAPLRAPARRPRHISAANGSGPP